ncbi:vesicular glutamate transporter 2-like [Lutzomyia longipalpis]|uniref:vesicular glutamate transporter 2-like n=1 Tax=Lutzomyia longipalpis TaxID=7200 RepID=UPI0024833816|nr:vesicular glutamate transporter 2-like [Lutzomyia longipalpis]
MESRSGFENFLGKWKFLKSRRFAVSAMSFFGLFNAYTLRVSLSVAIVAMTKTVNVTHENGTISEEKEFDWDSKEQGYVLSSFFYGYICTQFLGGILANRFGGHIVFGIGIGVSSILVVLSPVAARLGIYHLMAARIIIGLFEGVSIPSIQEVFARWAPIYERTTISGIVACGLQAGTFVAFLLSGFFAQHLGWESVFYIFGGFGAIWFTLWMIYIKKDPASDPRITPEERTYIEENIEDPKAKRRLSAPWKDIFTSSAVYAVITANFCDLWVNFTLITELPAFLNDVLGYDLGTTGILAAAPYLLNIAVVFTISPLFDYLRSRKILTTVQVRKLGIAVGFTICGIFLAIIPNLSDVTSISVCLIISIGVIAISSLSYFANPLDFAPNYAAILIGISQTVSVIPGIVSPILTGYIVRNGSQDEWQTVFYVSAGFCVPAVVAYMIFGKGKLQKWATTATTEAIDEQIKLPIN